MLNIKSIVAGASLVALQAVAAIAPVTQPEQLNEILGDVQVVDIRGSADAYTAAHIPGAVNVGYGTFRGPKSNPGQVPATAELEAALEKAGLTLDKPVVVAHQGKNSTDFGAAARVYWTLKSLGFEELSILNGGTDGYAAAGFELVSGGVTPVASELDLEFNAQWLATADTIQSQIESGEGRLLDSRLPAFFKGEAWHGAAKKPGILPGSDNFAFTAFFDDASLKSQAEVNQIVAANGLAEAQTVSYCNTGHWAATNWFVLSEVAQVPDVTLYAESMVAWSNADLPMENVPNPVKFALLKAQKWAGSLSN